MRLLNRVVLFLLVSIVVVILGDLVCECILGYFDLTPYNTTQHERNVIATAYSVNTGFLVYCVYRWFFLRQRL